MNEGPVDNLAGHRARHDTAEAGLRALEWVVRAGESEELVRLTGARVRRRRRQWFAGVGVVAALFAVAIGLVRSVPSTASSSQTVAMTSVVVVPARHLLVDGSVVDVKEGAQMEIHFSPEVRRIVLAAGEAHFQVAKDPLRPFVVSAGGVEVRAVGTEFSVVHETASVEVLVTEGRVAVAKARGPQAAGTDDPPLADDGVTSLGVLDAGSRLYIELVDVRVAKHVPVAASATEIRQRLAWRVPRLEFSGTPLAEVVEMFNRHGGNRLVIDPSIAGMQVSGALRADDVESLLIMVQNEFGIGSHVQGDGTVLLRRR